MRRILPLLPLLLLAVAAQAAAEPGPRLRVVIKQAEPFVFADRTPPAGYSIELWDEVARLAGYGTSYTTVGSVGEMIEALNKGRADVGVGALSITAERESRIDFSHGIYDSGLGLMVRAESGGGAWIVNFLRQSKVLWLVGLLLGAIFVNANILWLIQRRHDGSHFPPTYLKGVGEAMWWSVSVFFNGCCENKELTGAAARLLAVFWFVIGVTSISYVTATLASSMTLSELKSQIHDLADLKSGQVATVGMSQAAGFLAEKHLAPVDCRDIGEAIDQLRSGKVRAVFYDLPILHYQQSLHRHDGLVVLPAVYLPHEYGFGLQPRSQHRKEINRAILTLKENGRLAELRRKWFGDAAASR